MFAATVKQPFQILVQLQIVCTQALKECKMDVCINMSATVMLAMLIWARNKC